MPRKTRRSTLATRVTNENGTLVSETVAWYLQDCKEGRGQREETGGWSLALTASNSFTGLWRHPVETHAHSLRSPVDEWIPRSVYPSREAITRREPYPVPVPEQHAPEQHDP